MAAAAAAACCAARPPCLSGKAVPSPAAQTAVDPEHGAVGIGGEEALPVVRQSADPGSYETGQRNDPLGLDRLTVRDYEPARPGAKRNGIGANRDAALGQQTRDVRRDAGAERLERAVLGRDDDEADIRQSAGGAHVLAGHQRQLVQRQGPGDRGGYGEGHALHAAGVDVVQQRGEGGDVARTGERQGSRNRDVGHGANRDEQRIVVQRVAAHCAHPALLGIDRREPVGPQVSAVVGGDADEIEARRGPGAERLGDRTLALDEVGVGLEQLDLGG